MREVQIHTFDVRPPGIPSDFEYFKPPSDRIGLWWLGQAGFLFKGPRVSWVVDPYLSDSLSYKYQGREFDHKRLHPAPFEPGALPPVHAFVCTHGHTDHMDPWTIRPVAQSDSPPVFIVPAAEHARALERGVPPGRMHLANAGEEFEPDPCLRLSAIPAAHEDVERDGDGNCRFLGYIFEAAGMIIYHSGDSVPFEGLVEVLRTYKPDVALLPVNGRDEYRRERGIPGNFTVEEAAELCDSAGIPVLVPHHVDLFSFNTESRSRIEKVLSATRLRWTLPRLDQRIELNAVDRSGP